MNRFDSHKDIPARARNGVLVIGNFDGVHRGHQALLTRARAMADAQGLPLGVLTFEPHPRRVLRPDDPPFRLTDADVKAERLAACGVDNLFALTFDWDFASQSAETFIDTILRNGIAPAHIIIGPDFRFGQMRKGTPALLQASGLPTTILDEKTQEDGQDISSTLIRQALQRGDIQTANRLLGWPWEIRGPVVKGDQRGRTIGYPTANTPLGETIHPSYGIYACLVRVAEDGPAAPWMAAATNIGIRPMFEVPVGQVESYIFDFDRDIYGKTLHIRPLQKLRGEARFDSLEDLIGQIEKDCTQVRDIVRAYLS